MSQEAKFDGQSRQNHGVRGRGRGGRAQRFRSTWIPVNTRSEPQSIPTTVHLLPDGRRDSNSTNSSGTPRRGRGRGRGRGAARGRRGRGANAQSSLQLPMEMMDDDETLDPQSSEFMITASRGGHQNFANICRARHNLPFVTQFGDDGSSSDDESKNDTLDKKKKYQHSSKKNRKDISSQTALTDEILKSIKTDDVKRLEKILSNPKCIENIQLSNSKYLTVGSFEKWFITNNRSLHFNENLSTNPVVFATQCNAIKCLKLMVEKFEFHVDALGYELLPPLVFAVAFGYVATMEYLIFKGSSPSVKDITQKNLIHVAAISNQANMIKILSEKYFFDLNAEDEDSSTALLISASYRNLDCIKALLDAGALAILSHYAESPINQLISWMDELQSSKKTKRKFTKDNSHELLQEIRNCVIQLVLRSSMPTHAFESISDKEIQDICLEKMIASHSGKICFFESKLKRWQENFLSESCLNRFLQAFGRLLKKNSITLDLNPESFGILLKVLSLQGQISTIESLCSNFYQPRHASWISVSKLKVFSDALVRTCKTLLFGLQPFLENAIDFVHTGGKIYFRMILASELFEKFEEFDSLEMIWSMLDESLSCLDEDIVESDRFACLIHFYYLWSQVRDFVQKQNEESKASSKIVSLYQIENKRTVSASFSHFLRKNRNILLHIAEDVSVNVSKFFEFIPPLDQSLDLSARGIIFSKLLVNDPKNEDNEYAHISLNRMVDLNDMSSVKSALEHAVSQIISFPGKSLNGDIDLEFAGESGVGDGPMREALHFLFALLQKLNIFVLSPSSSVYILNSSEELDNYPLLNQYIECAGRIFGACITRSVPLGIPLSRCLIKCMTRKGPFVAEDLSDYDPDVAKSLKYILDNDVSSLHEMYFTCNIGDKEIHLIEGGDRIQVTNDNKKSYVDALVQAKCLGKDPIRGQSLSNGFKSVIVGRYSSLLSVEDVFSLINGPASINVSHLKRRTEYLGFEGSEDSVVNWFWEVFEEFDIEKKRQLLMFWSGSAIPPIASSEETNFSDEEMWTIERLDICSHSLPQSSTCTHVLRLPLYESKEKLYSKLVQAIQLGALGYDKA